MKKNNIDGWLLYSFHGNNPLAYDFLSLPADAHITRRFYYFIPANGTPTLLCHMMETHLFMHLDAQIKTYISLKDLNRHLSDLLESCKVIAMEYSTSVPSISYVDGGTIDQIRSYDIKVVSSDALLQPITSVWTKSMYESHKVCAKLLSDIAGGAFELIKNRLLAHEKITELDVQNFILDKFKEADCITDGKPICAVGKNSAMPHYSPTDESFSEIKKGDLILLDLWCKKKGSDAAYADITRMAIAATKASPKQEEVFIIVRDAQRMVLGFIRERLQANKPIFGFEVDRIVREYIHQKGYGKYFIHRTGHHIHKECHGNGTHFDDFETYDDRLVIKGTGYSVEPGIYIPGEFGVRLEIDIYISKEGELEVNPLVQEELLYLG